MTLVRPHIWLESGLWWCIALRIDGRKFFGNSPKSAYDEWKYQMERKYANG